MKFKIIGILNFVYLIRNERVYDTYLGCPYELTELRTLNDRLSAKVVEQVTNSQELVLINNFAHESNEYLFKTSLQERISDIASWRWVLEDLSGRLKEAIGTLQYEHNALRVVVTRIQDELSEHSLEASKPGVLCPLSDSVEEAILQEFNFLRDQKKKIEALIPVLDKTTNHLKKTKHRIETDVLNKQRALSVEESCASIKPGSAVKVDYQRKKRRCSPVSRWENRCLSLKRAGLQALTKAVIIRQQVRGARAHLSIVAQSYGARVDSALRRRLHTNKVKLQDLGWQKEEAIRDCNTLEEELVSTEQNIFETMEQERVVGARLSDRTLRPTGELTRDHVDRQLRDELGRLRNFTKQLRTNFERITTLKNHLTDSISRIECCSEDILRVVRLDESRISTRVGEEGESCSSAPRSQENMSNSRQFSQSEVPLHVIKEEDEGDDDYPFDD